MGLDSANRSASNARKVVLEVIISLLFGGDVEERTILTGRVWEIGERYFDEDELGLLVELMLRPFG